MSDAKPLKSMPPLNSDEEAERFVAEADLTEYDLSGFEPMRFELRRKDKTVSLRLPSELLDAQGGGRPRGHPVSALHAACDRAGSPQGHEVRSARIVEPRPEPGAGEVARPAAEYVAEDEIIRIHAEVAHYERDAGTHFAYSGASSTATSPTTPGTLADGGRKAALHLNWRLLDRCVAQLQSVAPHNARPRFLSLRRPVKATSLREAPPRSVSGARLEVRDVANPHLHQISNQSQISGCLLLRPSPLNTTFLMSCPLKNTNLLVG